MQVFTDLPRLPSLKMPSVCVTSGAPGPGSSVGPEEGEAGRGCSEEVTCRAWSGPERAERGEVPLDPGASSASRARDPLPPLLQEGIRALFSASAGPGSYFFRT